ncbi:MAG: hypothetical protein SGJ01_09880 [Gemmatimonadota bacterium]|nr:hypothetical protein [Gemmatimonadota bacterium]
MNRRGMALLVVLWLLVALLGATGVTLAAVRSGERASLNRLALSRGAWAAEACLAIARARWLGGQAIKRTAVTLVLDSVDLGAPLWCRLAVESPATRVHLNLATPAMLYAVFGDSALVAEILAGRPWPDVIALRRLSRCDSNCQSAAQQRLTVRGAGQIDPHLAPAEILVALPGIDRAGAAAILSARRGGVSFRTPEELLGVLPTISRQAVLRDYPGFLAATEWSPSQLVLHLEGHAGGNSPVAQITVTAIPLTDRLAIIRRELR